MSHNTVHEGVVADGGGDALEIASLAGLTEALYPAPPNECCSCYSVILFLCFSPKASYFIDFCMLNVA